MKEKSLILLSSLFMFTVVLSAYGAVFLPSVDFDDVDYITICDSLSSHSIDYFVFSDTFDTLRGRYGEKVIPYTVIDSVNTDSIEFIIIPGGTGVFYHTGNKKLLELIAEADNKGVLLGSIDIAGILIIESGAAENEKISMRVNERILEMASDNNVKLTAYDALVSNNIISSYMSGYREKFIRKFVEVYNENSGAESH
ncbi:MAG: DJ-1/PfpI family protein [candidate division WOR-3 bacterium]|nr:DJ-1/PfpI family protein [candidate division WOR-3 bacterium]